MREIIKENILSVTRAHRIGDKDRCGETISLRNYWYGEHAHRRKPSRIAGGML